MSEVSAPAATCCRRRLGRFHGSRCASTAQPLIGANAMKMPILVVGRATLGLLPVCAGDAVAASAKYACSGGTSLSAQFSPPRSQAGQVELRFADGRSVTLPQVMSADGGRYAQGDVEFWIKGNGATLKRGASTETCSTR